jgi:hypothetical protein
MTPYDVHDQVLQNLALLPPLTPDPARTARARARCRTQLACIQRRSQARFGRRMLAPAVVLGLCALYFASLLRTALTLRGVL